MFKGKVLGTSHFNFFILGTQKEYIFSPFWIFLILRGFQMVLYLNCLIDNALKQ
jgi:hypothetical protein